MIVEEMCYERGCACYDSRIDMGVQVIAVEGLIPAIHLALKALHLDEWGFVSKHNKQERELASKALLDILRTIDEN